MELVELERGLRRTRVSHARMIQRCYNERNKNYGDYGGRGIRVCDAWRGEAVGARRHFGGFEAFLEDMGIRPVGMVLDRIDPNGDYGPENCRWQPIEEMHSNTRAVRYYEYGGRVQSLAAWCRELGVTRSAMVHRMDKLGMSFEEALSSSGREVLIEYGGRKQSIKKWCLELGLNYSRVRMRLKRGWGVERAFSE